MGFTSDYDWGQGLKGAGGGALAGGALGGPVGAAIGGGVGLLSGFWNNSTPADDQQKKMLEQFYAEVQGRGAPDIGPTNQSATSGFRSNQLGLVNRLEAMANGTGPSLARQQFEQATDRNMRSQQAVAASGRGGPLSQLTAANNMAMLGANAAQGSALARTNEQMQAIGQLGGVIGQGRGQDEANSQFNAAQGNQMQIQQLDARLRAMGMNDTARMQLLGQMFQQNQAVASRPGLGDTLLAGGAGMFSMGAMQKASGMGGMGGGGGGQTSQASTGTGSNSGWFGNTGGTSPYSGNNQMYNSYILGPKAY